VVPEPIDGAAVSIRSWGVAIIPRFLRSELAVVTATSGIVDIIRNFNFPRFY
jgi:hypothetical protein